MAVRLFSPAWLVPIYYLQGGFRSCPNCNSPSLWRDIIECSRCLLSSPLLARLLAEVLQHLTAPQEQCRRVRLLPYDLISRRRHLSTGSSIAASYLWHCIGTVWCCQTQIWRSGGLGPIGMIAFVTRLIGLRLLAPYL